ncbi:MAG: hypothetical protein FP813_13580 [Desulfurivibrio sp.]|nr:hypothetical protein [Desulfurivibrio sp.]MBU4034252.1 hypothetical protein [Pseudomonadota bacterium]MBU4118000.1 hypothetical protein [Pseudomonadota bacterium]
MSEKKTTMASLCEREHACRGEHSYCRPALPIDGDNFYFVGHQGDEECPYKKKYGSLHTCDCPVRVEMYQRYKI